MESFLILLGTGYLLGSISPGWLFGWLIKRRDIRSVGNKNTGASNTYRNVGPAWGILAGLFDISKGAYAYWFTLTRLDASLDLAILVGLAAVVGHVFPFYLGFRGGRGTATLVGLNAVALLYTQSVFVLVLVVGTLIYAVRISSQVQWKTSARKLLKLAALIVPIGFLYEPGLIKGFVFYGLLIMAAFELTRSLSGRVNYWYLRRKSFAKEKESLRLTGYTLFFISAYVLLNFFPVNIAVLALTFFVVADTVGPVGGQLLLRKRILYKKTLGGVVMIFAMSFLSGLFLSALTPVVLPFDFIFWGAIAVSILDLLSFVIDDNLLIPIGAALVMRYLL